jgi:hypothetical protein
MTSVSTDYLSNSMGKAATPGSILLPSKGCPFVDLAAHDTPGTLFLVQIVVGEKEQRLADDTQRRLRP